MSRIENNNTTPRRSILAANPLLRSLDNVNEHAPSNCATYGGITLKTIYFLLFSVVGIIVQISIAGMLAGEKSRVFSYKGFQVAVSQVELMVIIGVLIAGIILQLLAKFVRVTTPVTGALYCVAQGYFISFLIFKVLSEHHLEYLGFLALVITILIILVMLILYTTGIIRVTKKFRMVLSTLFFTMIVISLFMFIGSFIPVFQPIIGAIRSNLPLSITFSVIFIIIAALFLVSDFNTIDHVVNDKLPKQYEWQAAFGLSFTVIWLYLKVLDLIVTIAGSSNKRK